MERVIDRAMIVQGIRLHNRFRGIEPRIPTSQPGQGGCDTLSTEL